jgi:hypothetical protein
MYINTEMKGDLRVFMSRIAVKKYSENPHLRSQEKYVGILPIVRH